MVPACAASQQHVACTAPRRLTREQRGAAPLRLLYRRQRRLRVIHLLPRHGCSTPLVAAGSGSTLHAKNAASVGALQAAAGGRCKAAAAAPLVALHGSWRVLTRTEPSFSTCSRLGGPKRWSQKQACRPSPTVSRQVVWCPQMLLHNCQCREAVPGPPVGQRGKEEVALGAAAHA